jgi:hypothetical protein
VIDLRDEISFEGKSVEELTASMRRAVVHYRTDGCSRANSKDARAECKRREGEALIPIRP